MKRSITGRRFYPAQRVRSLGRRLRLEYLEDRTLPSTSGPLQFGSLALDPNSYDPSRILVHFRPDAETRGISEIALVPGLHQVQLDEGVSVEDALRAYKADPRVLYAEPDYRVQVQIVPNDPQFSQLWGLHNTGQTGGTADADIDAPEAWELTTGNPLPGNPPTIVAVIDTGVDYTHPDLVNRMWTNTGETPGNNLDDDGNGFRDDIHGFDFVSNDGDPRDDHFHGTHVAGTIGAHGNNGVGVAGVNWNVQIMALKFLDGNGSGTLSAAISAINYAVANGAKISNNSWGGGGFSLALRDAIAAAGNAGHIFVAAAGNSGGNSDTSPEYPGAYDLPNIISVAATDHNDQLAGFSNYGAASVDLGAPGVGIYSTFPTYQTPAMQNGGYPSNYASISGTSMATPHVSGVVALVRGLHSGWDIDQVKNQIFSTVDAVPALQGVTLTGGRLNAAGAVGAPVPDNTGPRVLSSSPSGITTGPESSLLLTFSERIDTDSFGLDDVIEFTGPSGSLNVTLLEVVPGSNDRQFQLSFETPQSERGTYTLVIGPDILDLAGNAMNQNGDNENGQDPEDRYTASFTIADVLEFPSTDVPAPIYDWYYLVSYLTIDQDLTIGDLDVVLDVTHTWDSDLIFTLYSPSGFSYTTLAQFRGGDGDNFEMTRFDDEAATPIGAGTAPFSGSYQPETPLAVFDGENARGTWQLWVEDWFFMDEGWLNAWSLLIQPGEGLPPPPPPPVNQPPDAVDDYGGTNEDEVLVVDVLANDTDPDGDPLTIIEITSVYGGTVFLNGDNTITFTPDANYNGPGGFYYTISDDEGYTDSASFVLTIFPVNDPPDALNNSASTNQNTPVTINVLANDSDIDGDPLNVIEVTQPANGSAVINANQTITYTPASGFSGSNSFTYTISDGQGGTDTATVQVTVVAPLPGPFLQTGIATGVGNSGWTTVTLNRTYASMVVVATANYDAAKLPGVVRIRNASGNSFQVRVDSTAGGVISGVTVHYLVVEEGVFNVAQHGVKMEASKFSSTVTDRAASWNGQTRTYGNNYNNPVVLGQVMSYNDPSFSVFWSRGATRDAPPSRTSLRVGKHVGEDTDITRSNETIGYVVIESGSGTMSGRRYATAVGADTIRGVDNAPPYQYTLSGLTAPVTAIATQTGMDDTDGSWAILYGSTALTSARVRLAIDEDMVADAESQHSNEQVAYIVFDNLPGGSSISPGDEAGPVMVHPARLDGANPSVSPPAIRLPASTANIFLGLAGLAQASEPPATTAVAGASPGVSLTLQGIVIGDIAARTKATAVLAAPPVGGDYRPELVGVENTGVSSDPDTEEQDNEVPQRLLDHEEAQRQEPVSRRGANNAQEPEMAENPGVILSVAVGEAYFAQVGTNGTSESKNESGSSVARAMADAIVLAGLLGGYWAARGRETTTPRPRRVSLALERH